MNNTPGDASQEALVRQDKLEAETDDCRKHLTQDQSETVERDVKAWHDRHDPEG